MKNDITSIASAVITLIVAIVTTFVIPYIKERADAAKLAKIQKWVQIGVQAAEMIYKEAGMGKTKKEYVLHFIESKGYKIDLESLDNLIESAVLEMKNVIAG